MWRAIGGMLVLAFLGFTGPAQAQTPSPLTGESLRSTSYVSATGTCPRLAEDTGPSTGTATYTFEISGTASGPYPGTFVEEGSFTIGPIDEEFLPGQFRGEVTAFEASYTITSAAGTVEGTETLVEGATLGVAICGDQTNFGRPGVSFGQVGTAELAYSATITLPGGTRQVDTGRSDPQFNFCAPSAAECGESSVHQFFEDFVSQPTAKAITVRPFLRFTRAGQQQCLDITVTGAGGVRVPNAVVRVAVTISNAQSARLVTGADGTVTYCYTPARLGFDWIRTYVDANDDNARQSAEPRYPAFRIIGRAATATLRL